MDSPALKTTLRRKEPRGGQHVGTGPSIMRVELADEDDVLCAVEIRTSYRPSQHRVREIAMQVIELICSECDLPTPGAPQ